MSDFATAAQALENGAGMSRDALIAALTPVHAQLVKLEGEAPPTDTVDGKSVKEDLGTLVAVSSELIGELQNVSPSDPAAVQKVLSSVNQQHGEAVTNAVNRLDAYASKVCKISTSTSGPTTSAAGQHQSRSMAIVA
jgi:hypothetical protein